ncbi:MAG: polyprenyl synthetase family protein [Candidatus Obscuribacterales bacterium]|nr:polyprenyl synthetase family protein [Candidatus Obscuribacterales bacterium]
MTTADAGQRSSDLASDKSNEIDKPAQGAQAVSPANQSNLDMNAIIEPVAHEMKLVEEWLTTNLIDDSAFVGDLLKQLFMSGGKRIRPLVSLLASKASLQDESVDPHHCKMSRLHIILAVLTELIHSASLVHDDVIDKADTRRGKATVNKRFNDKMAVLLGDLLFAQASICLARIMNPNIVGVYGQVLGDLCSGEISQMRQQFSLKVDFDAYIQKSIGKTASLIAAGAHCGAILNARDNLVVQSLKDYGLNLGICFQIVDDLLDVTGSAASTGKPVGGDLKNGLITAPGLYILERQDDISSRFAELIQKGKIEEEEGLQEAIAIMKDYGGVEQAERLAQSYGEKARQSLAVLADSPARQSLSDIIDYVLLRKS